MAEASKIFLLSPASLSGERARQLLSPDARFDTARRYRSPEGVPIEEAFAFLSSLYFRGKIAYAQHFADPPDGLPSSGVLVIAPGFGLVPEGWALTAGRMETLRRTPIDLKNPDYAEPMRQHALQLREALPDDTRVVLLGSIATGKYVDLLLPVFGDRLLFPGCFVGIGDMSRGSVLLRAVREDSELEYSTLDVPRHKPRPKKGG
ncbi:MAG TPA: hypothetical protein VN493_08045 [Thermoanaerobaculia bacterium]|nr:hypothetical protein [Thermoanaerobaculia bacterium]